MHSVQALDGVPDCMHADRPDITPFVGAALAAVAQWQFFGAGLCTWQQEQAECADGRAEVSPLAIRLSYRFVFRSNGRVDARALNAGGGAPILSAALLTGGSAPTLLFFVHVLAWGSVLHEPAP